MVNQRLLKTLIVIYIAIAFYGGNYGLNDIVRGDWKASTELVERLSKRRSETNYHEEKAPAYKVNPRTHELEDIGTDIIYSSEAAMGGVLTIFCLKTGKIVFEAKHKIIKRGNRVETEYDDCLTSLMADIFSGFFDASDYFDSRPDVSEPGVFGEQLFNEIISNLPNES